jgi:homopolymeric O-antigen transport system ATP-binding protein
MSLAIKAQGLSKRYRIGELQAAYGTLRESMTHAAKRMVGREHRPHEEEIWALDDVSFDVREGEALGVIGRNGAGKSTLLKVLTRITTPTKGRAEIRGRVGSLLEVGTGFHPELTGRENIYLNGSILGMKRRELTRKLPDIIEFSGIDRFIDTPVKRYSSGMYVRLAFAVAAHLEPEVMLVDEVLAVGDAEFQKRCLGRMEDLNDAGRTVLFVSHNLSAISQLCDRALLLDNGRVVRDGPSAELVAFYLQTVGGTESARTWADLDSAPGNDLVRMTSARVVDENGVVLDSADVRHPVGIEIEFTVLRYGEPIFPKIKVFDARRDVAFNALDTSERWHEPAQPGSYVATAWIPGNLLNEGSTTVDIAICSFATPNLRHHANAKDIVSFNVYDPAEGDSARGRYTGQWRGVVRPLLEWTCERD